MLQTASRYGYCGFLVVGAGCGCRDRSRLAVGFAGSRGPRRRIGDHADLMESSFGKLLSR